jgi:hypothetical protein
MNIELATALYNNIGRIKHLRTFEFIKAIKENQDSDLWSRITYAKWRDQYGIHAFILNVIARECQELGLIEVGRENKVGLTSSGGKGTKRIYKLILDKVEAVQPNAELKQESIELEPIHEKVELKRSPMSPTKFNKGMKVSVVKQNAEKKPVPSKKAVKPAPKKVAPKLKVSPNKAPVKKTSKKK